MEPHFGQNFIRFLSFFTTFASEKLFWGLPVMRSSSTSVGLGRHHHPPLKIHHPLLNVLWYLKKEGYAETTIIATGKRLRHLSKQTNLNNPEEVKGFIANKECSNGFKESLIEAYNHYATFYGIKWNKPFYKRYEQLPKIPTEEQLNMFIAKAGNKYALILSLMKELGCRPIEITWLRVKDFDLENKLVTIKTAKHGKGRILKFSSNTLAMLKTYININKLSLNDRLFPVKSSTVSNHFRRIRNNLAEKLQDYTFKTIRLYDFRHWKATMLYHKTKDLLFVKTFLGHHDLRSTLRYTQLLEFKAEEYHSATAKNIEEAKKLIEQGFEYVTEVEGVKLFRKRK